MRVGTGQNPIMVPGSSTSSSQQAVPNDLQSPTSPLFIAPTPSFLFLFHFSTVLVHLSVSLGLLSVWGLLRSDLRSSLLSSCTMVPGRSHLEHGMPPSRLVSPSGPQVLVWQSLQAHPSTVHPRVHLSGVFVVSSLLPILRAMQARLAPASWWAQACCFSENVRLLIIQMFTGQNTERRHSLSPLCHLLTHM